ncbi:MAG: hypothetical protein JRH19_12560 [Deltaproteobacteria bacterium]|nr:hypothetical protein [Deltaproteobacteria bacterium]
MKSICAGLLLISSAIILLEIALTRVFAIMLWHHLTYMVISIAMLGFGAAGSILTMRGTPEDPRRVDAPLALLATGFGVSVCVTFFLSTLVSVDTLEIWRNKWDFVSLAQLYALVFIPFLFGGAAVGMALTRLSEHVDRLYFFDLLGSAIGGGASVWLLSRMGSTATVLAAGALGASAGVAFALGADGRARRIAGAGLALTAALWLAVLSGVITWHVPYAPGKELTLYAEQMDQVTRIPSATAEVEVGPSGPLPPIIGGEFPRLTREVRTGRMIGQDGTAPTMLYENAADLDDISFLRDSSTAAGLVALRARGGVDPRVLVIGVGGGVDVMIALAYEAISVTAVEINAAMIKMVRELFDEYLGGLFRPGAHELSDRIRLVHGEGRSYVRSSDERFDIIQMSGVDSFTALSTGAYTLSEGYLYTVEAVKDFYEHLAPEGYIVYSRHIMRAPKKPRETMRLANIARQALAELAVEDPASQIFIMRAYAWGSMVIKRGAFTPEEVEALTRFTNEREFWGVVFDPLHPPGAPLPDLGKPDNGVRADYVTLLRGDAAQRNEFVAAYPYELEPSRDDTPFFFNYYKYGELLRGISGEGRTYHRREHYFPDYPVGHVVLLGSLAQISLLAAVLILLPLRLLGRSRIATPQRWRVFAYFAALGAGFMLIEISLMQRMVLFLGHPTYAVSVVLTTLLASAGFGSLASGRIGVVSARVLHLMMAAILVILLCEIAAVAWLLPQLLGQAYVLRVVIAVLLLVPLGALLGMPFPLGIRVVAERVPVLLPWAWAINAFLSVFASIFCIVLAMQIGFTAVLVLAAGIYCAGILALAGMAKSPAAEPAVVSSEQ